MERHEPTFDSDPRHVESSPMPRRDPPPPPPPHLSRSDGFAWKIGLAVGAGVLVALLIFNAYERVQARRDAARAMQELQQEFVNLDREMAAAMVKAASARQRESAVRPTPPGYRCAGAALLHRDGNGWVQVTERSNHVYCPHGGSVADCYPVTPRSVGCR